jgi:hypothetical protein
MRTPYFLLNNMEGLRFAIGLPRKKTRQQKRDEARKALRARVKKAQREENLRVINLCKRLGMRPPFYAPDPRFIIKSKRWFLLKGVPNPAHVFMYHAGDTFHQIMKSIAIKIKNRCEIEKYKGLRVLARENQRVRQGFQALARRWIRARFRAGNEEDLLTGAVPTAPIILMDWKARRHYVFEPQTIFKDIVTRLQMSYCILFPKPNFPRNPYTNTDMTAGQFFSVVKQLRSMGMTHWTIEALYSVEYNLGTFEREMYLKLKNTILIGLFSNPKSIAGMEVVLEFIEDEHDSHRLHCNSDLYKWALEHVPNQPRITAWRMLCYKHYKISNMIPPHPDADSISIQSRDLCSRPIALELIRRNKDTVLC